MHCAEHVTETLKMLDLVSPRFVGGTAPPCVFADGPHGIMKLRAGSYGPMEIVKADDESLGWLEENVAAGNAPRRTVNLQGVPLSNAHAAPGESTIR